MSLHSSDATEYFTPDRCPEEELTMRALTPWTGMTSFTLPRAPEAKGTTISVKAA
jgi:hypothetical protein